MTALVERVRQFVGRHGLLSPSTTALDVALSGGLDSVVLCAVLVELAPSLGLTIRTHHVRHGLRPDDHLDAAHARATAQALGVTHLETALAPGEVDAGAGRGPEERARIARYAALEAAARAAGVTTLATAHHGDDNLETLLVRLVRGAGLEGLAGMAPVRRLAGDLRLVRPLLGVSRAEIEAFAQARGLRGVADPSNAQLHFLRNWMRHQVVPPLFEARAGGDEAARRSVLQLRGDAEALSALVSELVSRGHRTQEPAWYLELELLHAVGPEAAAQVLRHAAREVAAGHVMEGRAVAGGLRALGLWPERLGERAPGRSGLWQDGAVAIGAEGAFVVVRARSAQPVRRPQETMTWLPEGPAAGEPVRVWRAPWGSARIATAERALMVVLPPQAGRVALTWAGRVQARMQPAGMAGHKEVVRLSAELGVPPGWRACHPVLVDGRGEPLWIAGGARSARVVAALEVLAEETLTTVVEIAPAPWYLERFDSDLRRLARPARRL